MWTGPLVFENESNLQGMAKIITSLTDELCPTAVNKSGVKIPICPTTFSGDQKTEKAGRSAQIALLDNGSMRDKLAFVTGRHELLHFLFMFTDLIMDIFSDSENLEEATCLSRLIKLLNPRLENKKAKDLYYAFRDAFNDIFVAQLGQALCSYLNVSDLDSDVTPGNIRLESNKKQQIKLFRKFIRSFIRQTNEEFKDCQEDETDVSKLPPFYPHHKYMRKVKKKNIPSRSHVDEVSPAANIEAVANDDEKEYEAKTKEDKKKIDAKNEYFRGLLSILGSYQLLLDSIKEGNGLNSYLIQKLLLKLVQATGHKNYSCSMMSFKNIVLKHSNPQYSHRFMWNVFAGRAGKSLNFPRDMKNEHLNRYLKNSFRSLGVNLNEQTARRVNNSADVGLQIEVKINKFFDINAGGKSHTTKNREAQIKKLMEIFKKEKSTSVISGRVFKGPDVKSNVFTMYDEVKFRSWHSKKEKEMLKIEKLRENYFYST